MLKRILLTIAVMLVSVMFFAGTAMAAPVKLSGDEKSTASLVGLSKPEENFSTFSDSCIISGKSKHGVKITIYIKEKSKDPYEKLVADNEEVSWTVGVSGIFAKEIGLHKNKTNKLIIYAEKDDDFQLVKREITVKTRTLKQILKNEVVKIEDLFGKIITK